LGLLVFAPLEELASPTVDVSNKLLGFSSLVAARLASLSCFTGKNYTKVMFTTMVHDQTVFLL